MSDDDKKVFISYRRALSSGFARSVYQHLTGKGYDAFMDVESLDSGEFRRIILGQIKARPHFLALLTPRGFGPHPERRRLDAAGDRARARAGPQRRAAAG
jgi:TIR domain